MTTQYRLVSIKPVDLTANIAVSDGSLAQTLRCSQVLFESDAKPGTGIAVTFAHSFDLSALQQILPEGTKMAVTEGVTIEATPE